MPCRAYVSLAAGLVYLQVELALDGKHPMGYRQGGDPRRTDAPRALAGPPQST